MSATPDERTIRAECHSDDRRFEIEFDAVAWFQQAETGDITRLYACGWGGDYPADAIADYYDGLIPEITNMFEYCRATTGMRNSVGFECHVDEDDAVKWIRENRDDLEVDEDGVVTPKNPHDVVKRNTPARSEQEEILKTGFVDPEGVEDQGTRLMLSFQAPVAWQSYSEEFLPVVRLWEHAIRFTPYENLEGEYCLAARLDYAAIDKDTGQFHAWSFLAAQTRVALQEYPKTMLAAFATRILMDLYSVHPTWWKVIFETLTHLKTDELPAYTNMGVLEAVKQSVLPKLVDFTPARTGQPWGGERYC